MFRIKYDPESPDFRRASRWTLPGLALQVLGAVADIPSGGMGFTSPMALVATALGTAFVLVGVYYLARSKHRSPAWALLGLLSLFGWILVAFIEDRAPEREDAAAMAPATG